MRRLALLFAVLPLLAFATRASSDDAPPSPPAPPAAPVAPVAPIDPAAPPAPPPVRERAAEFGLPAFEARRCAAVDLDGNGYADLVFNAGQRVFFNYERPAGSGLRARAFVEATDETGLKPKEGRGADVLAFGDVNGDGFVDCFYGRNCDFGTEAKKKNDDGRRSEILLNDGKGRFRPVPNSGVGEHAETTSAATFVDVDRDGVLDLFVGNWYVRYGEDLECYPSRLFHGVGDGTFVDVTEKAGMLGVAEEGRRDSRRPVYGVSHVDWDGDGDEDLLVCAYGRQWNQLWRNNGDGTFTDVADATNFDGDADESGKYPEEIRKIPALKDREDEKPFRSNGNTFDCPSADFDGDGDFDVFLGEITHWWAGPSSDRSTLLVNQGTAKGFAFSREERGIVRTHKEAHWNQGDIFAGFVDVDGDGFEDVFIASGDYPDDQRLRLFEQNADHTFRDTTAARGVDWTNCSQPAVADLDHDGRPEIILGNSNMRASAEQAKARTLRPAVFSMPGGAHFVRIVLEGKGTGRGNEKGGGNRTAIGARVVVRAGDLVATREVFGSRGCGGQVDEFALTVGLGSHAVVDSIEIRWPDAAGTVETTGPAKADRELKIRQGEHTKWD